MAALSSQEKVVKSSTEWTTLIDLAEAQLGRAYALRLRGYGVDYRVQCRGLAGDEDVVTGSISGTSASTVRVTGLPTTSWGGPGFRVQAKLTTTGDARRVAAEVTWIPIEPGVHPHTAGAPQDQ